MSTFSALLSQNAFAMLQSLNTSHNRSLGDKGVALLVEGLLVPACCTRLTLLNLNDVGMGDVGMAAFSALFTRNSLAMLQSLKLPHNCSLEEQRCRMGYMNYCGLRSIRCLLVNRISSSWHMCSWTINRV
jgi:hypothetical protein